MTRLMLVVRTKSGLDEIEPTNDGAPIFVRNSVFSFKSNMLFGDPWMLADGATDEVGMMVDDQSSLVDTEVTIPPRFTFSRVDTESEPTVIAVPAGTAIVRAISKFVSTRMEKVKAREPIGVKDTVGKEK